MTSTPFLTGALARDPAAMRLESSKLLDRGSPPQAARLTRWTATDRSFAADLARRLPALIPAAPFQAHWRSTQAGVGDYLLHLRWLERAGLL